MEGVGARDADSTDWEPRSRLAGRGEAVLELVAGGMGSTGVTTGGNAGDAAVGHGPP